MENYNSFFQILESEEKKEFEILFEDKTTWYGTNQAGKQNWDKSKDKIAKFDKILKDFIEFQVDNETNNDMYNLSYIVFPLINFKAYFENNTITQDISFENAIFQGETYFNNISFMCNANFKHVTFSNIAMFKESIFQKNADFYNATFKSNANFLSTAFKGNAYFPLSKFEGDAIFASAKFHKTFNCLNMFIKNFFLMDNVIIHYIKFNGLVHGNASYLKIIGLNNNKIQPLNKNHFANKESARLIKDHFEKQNNITEANKYFVIEQEKYIEELGNNENKTDDNRVRKLIPLYFNKIVSHFGTDWVRAILILLLWGIIADNIFLLTKGNNLVFDWKYFGFSVIVALSYIVTYGHNIKGKISKELFFGLLLFIYIIFVFNDNLNHIVKLLNPINAFKDDDIFKGYEAFGALVRVISATIIYQIIVAFRQFTRRG